jgi:hypothetical protein
VGETYGVDRIRGCARLAEVFDTAARVQRVLGSDGGAFECKWEMSAEALLPGLSGFRW